MDDRRQTDRIPASLFVRFYSTDADQVEYGCFSQDVSIDGMKVYSPYKLEQDTPLDMNLDIPNSPEISLIEANVRWMGEASIQDEKGSDVFPMGVAFSTLGGEDRNYLQEYLTSLE
ncbi:MAG: PilZ domain-containing protein [PVC group bacterium]|nr:PilZ domain-containing protein [PVC group bacterium]